MFVKISPITSPAGKLAEAEVHFTEGLFEGLKLIGFGVFETAKAGRHVTFPSRVYTVGGESRRFALLRPTGDVDARRRVETAILTAYAAFLIDATDTVTC